MCKTVRMGLYWGQRLDKQTIRLSITVLDRSLLSDVLGLVSELNEAISALNSLTDISLYGSLIKIDFFGANLLFYSIRNCMRIIVLRLL